MAAPPAAALAAVFLFGFWVSPVLAQQAPQAGAPATDISNIPKPVTETLDTVHIRNLPNDMQVGKKIAEKDESCLLPPLTLTSNPTIAAAQLKITAKARKEYHQACAALKNNKTAGAEKHLRKAVQYYPKYSAAWVTLGQVLAAQQRTEEARSACSQGSIVNPGYVPAYLCLADIAARAQTWDEVLKLSGRALELDPSHNAVAYEYHAAANLNLHNLPAGKKSGLRAVEIDKDHHEPRVHFVLAQIYEAEGDSA
ncbi:MAG TPA: tetratricopeptide repeat protein, partial [Terriglobales bacterium]|nr:tetratricopeptide repeat protein [Terriglobales bacterium]